MFKEYNWVMLKKIMRKNKKKKIICGISEDWGWTAKVITMEDVENKNIMGLSGSWVGTPIVVIGDDDGIDCYIEKEENEKSK